MVADRVAAGQAVPLCASDWQGAGFAARVKPHSRPEVRGKFLFVGEQKFYIRGVTYGTFRPDTKGNEFPTPELVENDFAQMAAAGVNAVRTYTPPPRWILDAA